MLLRARRNLNRNRKRMTTKTNLESCLPTRRRTKILRTESKNRTRRKCNRNQNRKRTPSLTRTSLVWIARMKNPFRKRRKRMLLKARRRLNRKRMTTTMILKKCLPTRRRISNLQTESRNKTKRRFQALNRNRKRTLSSTRTFSGWIARMKLRNRLQKVKRRTRKK
uniref:(northern house mosquito) hypothetical protein n=1 Tax=Culex pipiens TaxID=7175 RepID=A0A8D8FLH5_CULPI